MSGIFNWALIGLRRLLNRGGFEFKETEKVRDKYQRMASPLYAFVKDCIEVDSDGWISKENFYNAYADYCRAKNLPTSDKSVVGKELPAYIHVESSQPRVSGRRVRIWKGIKFGEKDKTDDEDLPEEDEQKFWS